MVGTENHRQVSVVALPSWWSGPDRLAGTIVQKDGAFELPHVGPGTYNVSSLPWQPAGDRRRVSSAASNWPINTVVSRFEPVFRRPVRHVACRDIYDLSAAPSNRSEFTPTASTITGITTGETRNDTFHLGAVPPGRYRLRFASPEIETKETDPIAVRRTTFKSPSSFLARSC